MPTPPVLIAPLLQSTWPSRGKDCSRAAVELVVMAEGERLGLEIKILVL